jgi:zinc protease
VQPGQTPEAVADALIAELDRLRNEPISDGELQRTKNQFARDYIFSRESNKDKARHLGHAAVIHDDITTADGEFDVFMSVTAADVQRVAKTYFSPENRLVLTILPRGARREPPDADPEPFEAGREESLR